MRPGIGLLANVGISPGALVDLGREIEQAGFSGIWMIEYEYDSVALAQAVASQTSRAVTGTCITRAFSRHPVSLANTAAVIDRLAPGRFVIGLGSGTLEAMDPKLSFQRWGQPWDRPVARMREYVQILRRALDGELLGYEGEFYDLRHVQLELLPESRVPIFIAGGGKRMIELVAEEADGVFVHLVDRVGTERTRDTLAAAARERGRDPDELDVSNLVMTCIDEDHDAAVAAMRKHLVEFYLTMSLYQKILASAGFGDAANTIYECVKRGDVKAAEAAVPDRLIEDFTITGTPADARRKLEDFVSWGTTMPILYPFPSRGDWLDCYRRTMETFADAK
ncbi:MAG: 5,10-methylenetetrahydromethanopterin reductase [Thermoleophilaceae bacterium]|jgi:alkanesulfonate monooxygenase SsuD/methylene tetrahydromethanopterin reductase-like flavin-dependent oxidoreductase (luciferase family)|nr:5,10-methylenetetrahydromethanopterin reductase [Thermoleophilaceae bacterium]